MDLVQYTLFFSRSRYKNRVKYGDTLNRIGGRVYRSYKPKEETVRSTPRPYISGRERKFKKVGSFKYESPESIQFRDKDVDRISYYMGKSIGIPDRDLNSINPNKSPGSNKSFKFTSNINSPQLNSTKTKTGYKIKYNSNKKVLWNLGLAGTALAAAGAYVGYKKYKRSRQNKKDKREYN